MLLLSAIVELRMFLVILYVLSLVSASRHHFIIFCDSVHTAHVICSKINFTEILLDVVQKSYKNSFNTMNNNMGKHDLFTK